MLDLLGQLSREQKKVRITLGKSYKGFPKVEGKSISIKDERGGEKALVNFNNECLIKNVTVIRGFVNTEQRRVYS